MGGWGGTPSVREERKRAATDEEQWVKRVARDEMEDVDGLRYVGDIVNAALRLLFSLRAIGIE